MSKAASKPDLPLGRTFDNVEFRVPITHDLLVTIRTLPWNVFELITIGLVLAQVRLLVLFWL